MPVSYDKEKREAAASKGRTLGTVSVAGLTFQGGVTPEEQQKLLNLYTEINTRHLNEVKAAATPAKDAGE